VEVSHTVKKAIRAQHVQIDSTLNEKDVREAVKTERYSSKKEHETCQEYHVVNL